MPAVVGEIVVGVLIGPSLLGWVAADSEPVIGVWPSSACSCCWCRSGWRWTSPSWARSAARRCWSRWSASRCRSPGRAASGSGSASRGDTALFVGAALTATSVGITARVFGDLRALATTEARIVLGAAVADDVLGL